MAGRGHAALWVKLYELELQLRLMRAARGDEDVAVMVEDDDEAGDVVSRAGAGGEWWSVAVEEGTCRGRQYDAYMRRRDARRHTTGGVAAAATERREEGRTTRPRGARVAAVTPSPLALNCAVAQVKRSPGVSTPTTTPRKESVALPRARTVNTGAAAAAKPSHQRRSSLGAVPSDFGDCVTQRPFLRRGSGTGGATTTTTLRLRAPPTLRMHDLPPISDAATATASPRRPPPRDQLAQAAARRRHHSRSVSELPLHHHHHHHTAATAALDTPRSAVELPSPQPLRARKQWSSPETTTPRAILSSVASGGGDSHKDFAKGIKKLLSFVRKSSSSSSKSTVDQHCPARPATGKPVMSTGWPAAAASPVTA